MPESNQAARKGETRGPGLPSPPSRATSRSRRSSAFRSSTQDTASETWRFSFPKVMSPRGDWPSSRSPGGWIAHKAGVYSSRWPRPSWWQLPREAALGGLVRRTSPVGERGRFLIRRGGDRSEWSDVDRTTSSSWMRFNEGVQTSVRLGVLHQHEASETAADGEKTRSVAATAPSSLQFTIGSPLGSRNTGSTPASNGRPGSSSNAV